MKSTIQLSLLLLALISLNLAAQTQTCNINALETAPASRFTINSDGTVTDTQTSLIWARCPQGLSGADCTGGTLAGLNWVTALNLNGTRPTSVTTGAISGTDWRLPNVKELQSLVERSCFSPAINETVFPNTPTGFLPSFFWSASPDAGFTGFAWGVSFGSGDVSKLDRGIGLSVLLGRSGQLFYAFCFFHILKKRFHVLSKRV